MTYEPRFTITPSILDKVMKITEGLTRMRYDGSRCTPHLRRINRLRSLHSSLAIEGNSLSFDEVVAIIDGREVIGPSDEIREVENFRAANDMMDSIDPLSMDDLLMMHGVMMDGIIESAGKLRKGDEGVFDGEGCCIHLAPKPEYVSDLMGQLLQWMRESNLPMILRSCIFHYQLEYIHPFEDGNGRMGRLWQTILLSKYDESFKWIPIETMVRSYQTGYYDAITLSNEICDCTPFLEFMTDVILKSIDKTTEESLKDNIGIEDDMTINEMRLYSMIRDGYYRDITQAANLMKVSVPTLNRCLKSLKESGTIKKVGNKKTGRWVIVENEMVIDHTDFDDKNVLF